MSEPSWMPSDFKMDTARVEAALLRETFGPDSDDNEPIRALISAAVEKALAEYDYRSSRDFFEWKKQEDARHKREVVEARINVLEEANAVQYPFRRILDQLNQYRAELAALDASEPQPPGQPAPNDIGPYPEAVKP